MFYRLTQGNSSLEEYISLSNFLAETCNIKADKHSFFFFCGLPKESQTKLKDKIYDAKEFSVFSPKNYALDFIISTA
jgi:hypothetical protein